MIKCVRLFDYNFCTLLVIYEYLSWAIYTIFAKSSHQPYQIAEFGEFTEKTKLI